MGRKHRSAEGKPRIALEAVREDKPIREIAEKYGVHPNQVSEWKRQLVEGAGEVFRRGGGSRAKVREEHEDQLLRELGQAQVEKAFLKKN